MTMDYSRKKSNGRRGSRADFFEKPLEFLGFCFNHGNSEQNKASPVEIPQNYVTPNINFKV